MAQQQGTSFGRIILTPILVMIVASIIASLDRNWFLPALLGGAILSIVYILWASRRRIIVAATTPQPGAVERDHLGDLERLTALRDSGALTQEEFDRQKAEILRRM